MSEEPDGIIDALARHGDQVWPELEAMQDALGYGQPQYAPAWSITPRSRYRHRHRVVAPFVDTFGRHRCRACRRIAIWVDSYRIADRTVDVGWRHLGLNAATNGPPRHRRTHRRR